jgi:hypothetical protein
MKKVLLVAMMLAIAGGIALACPWDINNDGTTDIRDIAIVALAFGSYDGDPAHPRWNPDADLNGDGVVDIRDIALVAMHFGELCECE